MVWIIGRSKRVTCKLVKSRFSAQKNAQKTQSKLNGFIKIGPPRFELGTSYTPCKRATRLRYGPYFYWYVKLVIIILYASFNFFQICVADALLISQYQQYE